MNVPEAAQAPGSYGSAVLAKALSQTRRFEPVAVHTWWRGDSLPNPRRPHGFSASVTDDYAMLAELVRLDCREVQARVWEGHRPYVAWVGDEPVAYGWSATITASMGELDLGFNIPTSSRYLWDFATLPAWRGLGIYPALLQAIMEAEGADAERFWIGHLVSNSASRRGIEKAGFEEVGQLEARSDGAIVLAPAFRREWRAAEAVSLLGLQLGEPANATSCRKRCTPEPRTGTWPPRRCAHRTTGLIRLRARN